MPRTTTVEAMSTSMEMIIHLIPKRGFEDLVQVKETWSSAASGKG